MKKVRMAVGAAVPAAGMLIMPAAAHASTTTRAGSPATTPHNTGTGLRPAATCPPTSGNSVAYSANGELFGYISYAGSCVAWQQATLTKRQTGLTERVRFRNINNQIIKQNYLGGTISGGSTFFWSGPNFHAHEVCEALVANNNHNSVKYGAPCEFTP